MKTAYFVLFCTLGLIANPAFSSQKIKKCGPNAESTIESAVDFLQNDVENIMNAVGDLTSKEKKKLRRKLEGVNIKCGDSMKVCDRADLVGVRRHLLNKSVVLCYNNIRSLDGSQAFCELSGTLLHEVAHAADVQKASNHNDGPNNDRVYRTGNAATQRCVAAGLDGSIPRNTND